MKTKLLLLALVASNTLYAQDMSGLKVFINPGHGGYDSDDRNVVIAPFTQGDKEGFWESVSNLDKGFYLRDMLNHRGVVTQMSRVQNTTADDLPLSTIVRMANEFEADMFLSIHSNASDGISNYPLMLFRGYTDAPERPGAKVMANHLFNNFSSNKIPTWTSSYTQVIGDWTFQPGWGTSGYGVLRGLTVDGVLSEGSFHDYIPETYRLMSQDYRKLEAWHFMRAIANNFDRGEIDHGNIAGQVRDSRLKNEATYFKTKGRDELLPIHKAKLTLTPGDIVKYTDELYNGVFLFDNLQQGEYRLLVEAEGYYSQNIEFVVTNGEVSYHDFLINRVRQTPPVVTDWSPKVESNELVECSTPIYISFNWDMDEESIQEALTIEPKTEGTITFEDSQYRVCFTPTNPWEVNTTYRVKLDKSAKHPDNIPMEEDFEFSFTTKDRNRLGLILSNPKTGDQDVHPRTNFRLIFDRVVKTAGINTNIKVVDESGEVVNKNVRTVQNNRVSSPYGSHFFDLTPAMNPGSEYRLIVSGSVLDEVNIPVVEEIVIPFRVGNVVVEDQPIVETFDNTDLITNDTDSNVECSKATAQRTTSRKLFGTAAWTLSTTFNQSQAMASFISSSPIMVENGDVIGLHIYGDLSHNRLELILDDASQRSYQLLTQLDFAAWQFRELQLQGLESDKSYSIIGYRLVASDRELSLSNDISLDNLLKYKTPITSTPEVEASIVQLYPNPVRDNLYVRISDSHDFISIKLFTQSGVLVRESNLPQISVASIPAGTYIASVELKGRQITKPIIIIR
ncbi:MAG: Ig-like domain-containing protein [Bacteroidales bacterium]